MIGYDRHVHKFIRTAIDMDKNRVFAQRLRQSVQTYFDEPWALTYANADRLLAAGKKGTVKPLDPSEIVKPVAPGEAPAAPAAKTTGSEVDLDIMVDE